MIPESLKLAQEKMQKANVDPTAIEVFSAQYLRMSGGSDGTISENDILPVENLEKLDDITIDSQTAEQAIKKTVIIKLNGGLGTSMGLEKAKSLLPVRDGNSFLDIVVKQILAARKSLNARLPLIFMNSFRTKDDTLEYLKKYKDLAINGLPLYFMQNEVPKIRLDTLEPVQWPENPELEWAPPGHGDIYPAILDSGLLDKLIDQGFEYASVSNVDNLGATPDAKLAGWFANSGAPFAMECRRRGENDKKGGHLAIRKTDGQLILREAAQVSDTDKSAFSDIKKYRYFNSNSIWLNLPKLRETLQKTGGNLNLSFIKNQKTVDPTNPTSPKVIQLESAMGSAIEKLQGAIAIEIPYQRFLPVKTTNELLIMRSDLFDLDDNYRMVLQAKKMPKVSLDEKYYKLITDFDKHIKTIPSLKNVTSLTVTGEIYFNKPMELSGDITLP